MKYLGIDYGTKRVGLSVSDDDGKIAFPKDVIVADSKLAEKITGFARAEKIETIIIGESKDFDGKDNPIMPSVKILAEALKTAGFKIFLEPEFLTSAQAAQIQGPVEGLDASAAAILLQSFLDRERAKAGQPKPDKIPYSDFQKVEMTLGKIILAEKIPETDKLLRLIVDFGEKEPRQIVSGISMYFPDTAVLVGKNCLFVTNLEPRMIRGHESNGMILALSTPDGKFSLLEPNREIPIGTRVK